MLLLSRFSANFDQVVDQAAWLASSVNDCVFAFAAGPISNLLIPVMWRANQHNTYVDFGGTLDLVVLGRSTRDFHPDTSEGEKTWVKAGGALQPGQECSQVRWSIQMRLGSIDLLSLSP
mmetsp:Transcript_43656/g.138062  ORF Transcript_43656/g.138062 Transcript_43656/m.138062 type:complete len:119 (-) Transcript_43656:256-612(-)